MRLRVLLRRWVGVVVLLRCCLRSHDLLLVGLVGLRLPRCELSGTIVEALPSVHAAVPPILHSVVTAAMKASCNLCPTLAHLTDHALDHQPLFGGDWLKVESWLEILVVSLATLLR